MKKTIKLSEEEKKTVENYVHALNGYDEMLDRFAIKMGSKREALWDILKVEHPEISEGISASLNHITYTLTIKGLVNDDD